MDEGVTIYCPLPNFGEVDKDTGEVNSEYFIRRPSEWYGYHSRKRDEVIEKSNGALGGGDLLKFAISMALAEDWNLPGLPNNPERWDFDKVRLEVIVWVNQVIYNDLMRCYVIPKN